MLKLLLVAVVLVGLSFLGIAIKMLFTKDGEFKKSCSSGAGSCHCSCDDNGQQTEHNAN